MAACWRSSTAATGPSPSRFWPSPKSRCDPAVCRATKCRRQGSGGQDGRGCCARLRTLRKLDDAEIIARLVSVRGIGQWTVEMLLIFHLGRPDVLPYSDLGVRKGFMLTYKKPELPTKNELLAHGERWRPYRSVASWYMWRATEVFAPKPKMTRYRENENNHEGTKTQRRIHGFFVIAFVPWCLRGSLFLPSVRTQPKITKRASAAACHTWLRTAQRTRPRALGGRQNIANRGARASCTSRPAL